MKTTTSRMSKEEYIYLHNVNNPTNWEALTNNNYTLKDIDRSRVKEVVRMAVFNFLIMTGRICYYLNKG